MPELNELARSIDAWTEDLPHNKHKQRLFEPLHTMDAWEEQLKNVEKIGSRTTRPAKEPFDLRKINTAIYNREKTIAHLDYLNLVLAQARGAPPLLLPGHSAEAVKAANVEELQTEWMRDAKLREQVLELKATLERAFKAYNNQATTVCLRKIHRRLKPISDSPQQFHALFGHPVFCRHVFDHCAHVRGVAISVQS